MAKKRRASGTSARRRADAPEHTLHNGREGRPKPGRMKFVALALTASAFLAGSIYLLGQPNENFTARLQPNTDIDIEYSGSYNDKKSPTCGCMNAGADEWRGISFLSRRIEIGPTHGPRPSVSSYMISAAFPSKLKPYSSGFLISPRHLVLRIPDRSAFEARAVANGLADSLGYKVLKDERIPLASTVTLLSSSPLFEETLGNIPEGTWIPSRGGRIRISKAGEQNQEKFTESFEHLKDPGDPAQVRDFHTAADVFSIVDLIGPRLIVWTRSPAALFGGKGYHALSSENGGGQVDVLLFDVPFALRTTLGAVEGLDPEKLDIRSYAADGLMIDPLPRGETSMMLDSVPGSPIDYSQVSNYARNHQLAEGCGPSTIGSSGSVCVQFLEPPVPASNTLNVFGQVQRIHFSAASGDMMVGSRHFDISPAVPVDLVEVNSFDNPLGSGIIPIQVADHTLSVDSRFAAKGAVTVNGEPLIRRIDHWGRFAGVIALLLSVGSVFAWAWTFVLIIRRPSSGVRTPARH